MIGMLQCAIGIHRWVPVVLQVSRPPRNPAAGEFNIHPEEHDRCARCYRIRFRSDLTPRLQVLKDVDQAHPKRLN